MKILSIICHMPSSLFSYFLFVFVFFCTYTGVFINLNNNNNNNKYACALFKVNGGTPDTWLTPNSDCSCNESTAADTSSGKGRCMRRWGSFPSAGVSAAADSLQANCRCPELPTCPEFPPFTLQLMGWVTQRVLDDAGFSIPNRVSLAKSPH